MSLDRTPPVDPLDVGRLPGGAVAADRCELDELLDDLSPRAADGDVTRYLLHGVPLAPLVGVLPRYAGGCGRLAVPSLDLLPIGCFLLVALAHYLGGTARSRRWLLAAAAWLVLVLGWRLQGEAPDAATGYLLTFPLAVAGCGAYAVTAAKQFAFHRTASLALDWQTAAALREDWAAYEGGREVPLELAATRRAVLALGVAVGAGFVCLGHTGWPAAGAAGYLGTLGLLLVPVWGRAWVHPRAAALASWRALRVFLSYNRTGCLAPGVFQLPTAWLRPHPRRYALTVGLLVGCGLSLGTALPARRPAPPEYPFGEQPPRPPETKPRPPMTRLELDHLERLAGLGRREEYLDLVRARRGREAGAFVAAGKKFDETALTTAAACVLIPPALLLGTLAFLFGPALVAYDRCRRGHPP